MKAPIGPQQRRALYVFEERGELLSSRDIQRALQYPAIQHAQIVLKGLIRRGLIRHVGWGHTVSSTRKKTPCKLFELAPGVRPRKP